jgi:signal transduction histidine kinase
LKLNDELRELYTRQQNIREEERKHIAREIHDELGQLITGLKMDISWLKKKIIAKQPELTEKMNETIGLLDESVKTIRKISSELRPGILDDLGITDALRWLAKDFERRTNIRCSMNNPEGEINCSDEVKVVVFRIFQETLTNVMRHAHATEVNAELSRDAHSLTMQIADNGKGFDVAVQTKTLGLLGMKERIINIKGELYISSAVGRGTTVTIIIPI